METRRRIDRITADAYVQDLPARPLADIRAMRAESQEEEALLSYERRLLHGRLAILRAELDRRSGGGEGSLIDKLPEILAGDERRPSRGSFPRQDPLLDFDQPKRRVSKLVGDDTLTSLPSLDDEEIRRILADLEDAEREASAIRQQVLNALDALNQELARRYKQGEADPGDVLTGGA